MKSEEFALKTNVLAFASRSKAKAKPRRRTLACLATRTVPICERFWTDIERENYSSIAYPVSKRLSTLLRHGDLPWEEDGAIEFWRLKDYLRNEFVHSQHWSDEKWKSTTARGGGNKKIFQYCTDPSGTRNSFLFLNPQNGECGRMNQNQELPASTHTYCPRGLNADAEPHRWTRSSVSCRGETTQKPLPLNRTGWHSICGTKQLWLYLASARGLTATLRWQPTWGTSVSHQTTAHPPPPQGRWVWPFLHLRRVQDTCVPSVCQPEQLRFWMLRRRALPSPRRADTNVVSITSWAPPKRGNPSATTSNLRLSVMLNIAMSRSITKTFVDTLAPASRHTLAAADSKAAPLPPNTPETAHRTRNSLSPELCNVIQDAVPLILHYRTVCYFLTISLRVHLSHRMCDQFTLRHKFRIDTRRTKFEQKTDGILHVCGSYDKRIQRSGKIDLEAPRHAWYHQKKWKKTSKHYVLGRHKTCLKERI